MHAAIEIVEVHYNRWWPYGCLTSSDRMVRAGVNAKEIKVPKIAVSGLGDYARNAGCKTGSITSDYETKAFNYDCGIKLMADVMDIVKVSGPFINRCMAVTDYSITGSLPPHCKPICNILISLFPSKTLSNPLTVQKMHSKGGLLLVLLRGYRLTPDSVISTRRSLPSPPRA